MEGLVASPSPPPVGKNPRRGRREKPWPPAKQRKLLRLYVCTQSERLPLKRILERLKDGGFDPRFVHCWQFAGTAMQAAANSSATLDSATRTSTCGVCFPIAASTTGGHATWPP